jgi:hypothetical protein
MRCALLVPAAFAIAGCATYESALGYRANTAARVHDVAAFEGLMEQAATQPPAFPGDKPTQTVLTHFLELGGEPRFMELIERWQKRGWVDESQTCSILRARYRGIAPRDRAEADRAMELAITRAREAARPGAASRWEVSACLEQAPFLAENSTAALARPIALAADPSEQSSFRTALIEGLTHIFIQDPSQQPGDLTPEEAGRRSTEQLERTRSRFIAILAQLRPTTEAEVLIPGSAWGALEIERVSQVFHRSYLSELARSPEALDRELAWGWVRALKQKDSEPRLLGLGLWDRIREPVEDAFWYLCTRPSSDNKRLDAISLLSRTPVPDAEQVRAARCGDKGFPTIDGPYPLEATARIASAAAHERAAGAWAALIVTSRIPL